jgi:ATP-binding cassette subfamily B protein/subfamily B ATP-binding cassette protein MsbA
MERPVFSDIPSIVASKPRSTFEILRRAAFYLKPYKLSATINISCALLSLGFSFAFPQITQFIIDEVIVPKKTTLLIPAIFWLLIAFLGRDFMNGLRIYINAAFEQNVVYDMRRDIYQKLQHLPVNYFDQRASGDLLTRLMEDVTGLERTLIDGTEQGMIAFWGLLAVLIILWIKNSYLTMFVLLPLPILTVGALWYTLTAHHRYRQQRQAASAMNTLLVDNLQGIRQIKAYVRQTYENQRFAHRADGLRRSILKTQSVWAVYSPAMAFTASVGIVLVLWNGGAMVTAGSMTLGELIGFLFYLGFFYDPVARLQSLNQMLQAARPAGERLLDILDAAEERRGTPGEAALRQPVRGEVRYDRVSFSYGDGWALQNISLHAAPGQLIALVGPTGSGKSTLVNLLPAFYELTSGRITIDSQDINQISLDSLRSHISVVSQEPFLFNGTVRENILYGKLDATEDEMLAASRAANCHDFIVRLPEGYDSPVGERGAKLSGGEKQRISVARALLKNAPILILDEATASVDTATEKLIQEALQRLMANRTSFVIAHRLSTIYQADQIFVLRRGEIIEHGTHAELVQQDGLYAGLVRIQDMKFTEPGWEHYDILLRTKTPDVV